MIRGLAILRGRWSGYAPTENFESTRKLDLGIDFNYSSSNLVGFGIISWPRSTCLEKK